MQYHIMKSHDISCYIMINHDITFLLMSKSVLVELLLINFLKVLFQLIKLCYAENYFGIQLMQRINPLFKLHNIVWPRVTRSIILFVVHISLPMLTSHIILPELSVKPPLPIPHPAARPFSGSFACERINMGLGNQNTHLC